MGVGHKGSSKEIDRKELAKELASSKSLRYAARNLCMRLYVHLRHIAKCISNRQLATGNRKQAIDNRQQAIGNKQ